MTKAEARLVLGRYRVVRRLTQGGMGVVYLGRLEGAAGFAKPVIIKRIIPDVEDLETSTARFVREAQILSNLQHPGIVGVLDFGQEEDGYAMVLEYMHGYDLGRWLKYLQLQNVRVPWQEAVLVMLRVLEALHYAHTFRRSDGTPSGVLHRDISPGNILLDLEGQVRLIDFGIARMARGEGDQYKTEDGVLKGKLAFMAPELFSAAPPSEASDVYACAIVLYQMLAGAHPFAADNDQSLLLRVITQMPRPLSDFRVDLPEALEAAIFESIAKEPEGRHASAEIFAQALRQTLSGTETEIYAGLRDRLRKDFTGEMPALLRLDSLDARERAWRSSWSAAPLPPLSSSRPLSVLGHALTVESEAPPANSSYGSAPNPRRERASFSLRRWGLPALGGALAVGLLATVGITVAQRQGATPTEARFIVVQSPDRAASPPDGVVSAGAPTTLQVKTGAAPRAATDAAKNADERAAQPSSALRAAATSSALSVQFARRQAALERCFERFTADVQGRPEVTVHFDVDASGHVDSAQLSPPGLNATPLGRCLLHVARETSFGKQRKPIRFSIPLSTRAVSP